MPELVTINAGRVVLLPLQPEEIDAEWNAMVAGDEIAVNGRPGEAAFRARLARSGQLVDGWLDLAIDVGGRAGGRIQTFAPADRSEEPSTYNIGIGLHPPARGQGYAADALSAFAGWLFESAGGDEGRGQSRREKPGDAASLPPARLAPGRPGRRRGRECLLFVAPAT